MTRKRKLSGGVGAAVVIFSGFLPDKKEQLIQSKINPKQDRIRLCTLESVVCKPQSSPASSQRSKQRLRCSAAAPHHYMGCVIRWQTKTPISSSVKYRPRGVSTKFRVRQIQEKNPGLALQLGVGAQEADGGEDEERHSRHQLTFHLLQEFAPGAY